MCAPPASAAGVTARSAGPHTHKRRDSFVAINWKPVAELRPHIEGPPEVLWIVAGLVANAWEKRRSSPTLRPSRRGGGGGGGAVDDAKGGLARTLSLRCPRTPAADGCSTASCDVNMTMGMDVAVVQTTHSRCAETALGAAPLATVQEMVEVRVCGRVGGSVGDGLCGVGCALRSSPLPSSMVVSPSGIVPASSESGVSSPQLVRRFWTMASLEAIGPHAHGP